MTIQIQDFTKSTFIRSPLFYVGDKYKLMPQLQKLFPNNIATYIEPFVGGGSSFLNVRAKKYLLNDRDFYLISLHKFLQTQKQDELFMKLFELIESYKLSCSLKNIIPSFELRKSFKKNIFCKIQQRFLYKIKSRF